jgi:hypothetical protein
LVTALLLALLGHASAPFVAEGDAWVAAALGHRVLSLPDGALVLEVFECISIPFLLVVLACHERRPEMPPAREIGRYPAFAVSTAFAVLFALLLPVSVGFYGVLLVMWSLVGLQQWPLPFLILSILLIALAGVRIMYFYLGEGPRGLSAGGEFKDLGGDELLAMLPLGFALLFLGLIPRLLMGPMGISVSGTLRAFGFGN